MNFWLDKELPKTCLRANMPLTKLGGKKKGSGLLLKQKAYSPGNLHIPCQPALLSRWFSFSHGGMCEFPGGFSGRFLLLVLGRLKRLAWIMFPPKVTIQQRSWSFLLMKVLKRFCDWVFIFHIFCWCKFISSVLISIMFQSSLCFEGKPKNPRMIWNHVFYRLSFYILNSTYRNWFNLTFPDFGPSDLKNMSLNVVLPEI